MDVKLITLHYSPALRAFDDAPLQEFLRGRDAMLLADYRFEAGGVPLLALLFEWEPDDPPRNGFAAGPPATAARPERQRRRDWVEELDARERVLYESLRAWRAQRAQADGIPPYRVFSNRELAGIARARPRTREALAALPGVGPAKLESFAREILERIEAASAAPEPPASAQLAEAPRAAKT
ncbi:MAG TPA: HRDC domain-containing protein [Planctomycetota bacterium]|nr:HRDC domain-containing protein [Planctomycetota bacterium]